MYPVRFDWICKSSYIYVHLVLVPMILILDPYLFRCTCQVGELIGGSQREERLDYLEARLDDLKLNKDSYWWYLDLRRYGSGQGSLYLYIRSFIED